MLAEKFFLVLEMLRSHATDDKPAIVIRVKTHKIEKALQFGAFELPAKIL